MSTTIKAIMACGAALLYGSTATFAGAILAEDYANDIVYEDGWTAGDNGGTNFGAWAFSGAAEVAGSCTIGSSTDLDPAIDINTSGKSFRLVDDESSYAHAMRDFPHAMNAAETFKLKFAAGVAASNKGLDMRVIGSGQDATSLFNLASRAGTSAGTWYIRTISDGQVFFTDGPHPNTWFEVVITQYYTSAGDEGGVYTVTRHGEYNETLEGTFSGIIGAMKVYGRTEGTTDADAIYFNSPIVEEFDGVIPELPPPPPTEDYANDEEYASGWANGSNGGDGFGPWNCSGWSAYQTTIGDVTDLHPDIPINTDGKCFRGISTSGYLQALRNFSASLEIGSSFSVDWAAGHSQNNQGFALRALGAGVNDAGIVSMSNRTGDGGWAVTIGSDKGDFIDDAHSATDENTWFNVTVKQTTAEGGLYTITRYGAITGVMSGSYTGLIGSFKFYANVSEDVDAQALYFNNLIISPAIEFNVNSFELAGGNATLTFGSEVGKIYKVQGCDDLMATWTNISDVIEATAPENTSTVSAASASFFRVSQVDRFFEDFENGMNGWVMDNQTPVEGRTEWEIGTPATLSTNLVVSNANSPTSCAATVLDDICGKDNTMDANTLRSPIIPLGTAEAATLSYFECASIENYDEIGLNILDSTGSLVTNVYSYGGDVKLDHLLISNWTERVIGLPISDLPEDIILEFYFNPDNFNDGEFSGWYIDDVKIK